MYYIYILHVITENMAMGFLSFECESVELMKTEIIFRDGKVRTC